MSCRTAIITMVIGVTGINITMMIGAVISATIRAVMDIVEQ